MRWRHLLLMVIGLLGLVPLSGSGLAAAPPPGPDRYAALLVEYTAHEWWLVEWGGEVACQIVIDHTGLPTLADVYRACGEKLYKAWSTQQPCPSSLLNEGPEACYGYYLQFVRTYQAMREIAVALPEPKVWLTLEGCTALPALGTQVCPGTPTLVLTGDEPLPNEHILRLEGTYDGTPFVCDPVCRLELGQTGATGLLLEFWAYSSYGDSSHVFQALVRVAPTEDSDPEQEYWYVDVLSLQWAGEISTACGESWDAFPPVGGVPAWLSTPPDASQLSSRVPYTLLAGMLIRQGLADAGQCADGGLLPNGAASPCGLEATRETVDAWQNRYDERILEVARETGVPAQLIKNLFARESQFWPGAQPTGESGLGHLTEGGADIALLWNPSFFAQFCPLVLAQATCDKGYLRLTTEQQQMLRAALVNRVDAACPGCPLGLDPERLDYSIEVFAHTLRASCDQTGRMIRNLTGVAPGRVSGYEDLWKFTLANYNAGPGCLGEALEQTLAEAMPLTWEQVSARLDPACQGAMDYVDSIARTP